MSTKRKVKFYSEISNFTYIFFKYYENLRHNTEKVIYFLLLERKLKNPCNEDQEEAIARSRTGKNFKMF